MTTYNKTTLKTFFEQGDTPTGTNYADLIDSQVNLVETAIQSMAGPLSCTELITPRVSANTVAFGGSNFTVNALTFAAFSLGTNYTVSAGNSISMQSGNSFTVSAGSNLGLYGLGIQLIAGNSGLGMGSSVNLDADTVLSLSGLTVNVSADTAINLNSLTVASAMRVTTVASANKVYSQEGYHNTPAIVSAAGTTQGAATIVSAPMARLQGVNDGTATGFALMANRSGLVQYLFNQTAASANLWPPTGGTINGLGANAAFGLTANTMYTVLHISASAYAVK